MQETSATEVCVSTFSFFLREKVGRERWQGKTQTGEESLSGQREPQQQRGLSSEDQAGAAAVHVS